MSFISRISTGRQGRSQQSKRRVAVTPPVFSETGWNILMMYTGKKVASSTWIGAGLNTLRTSMGSPGTSTFMTMTAASTGANGRTALGQGQGLYNAFFTQTGITKVALVDGSGSSLDPTSHTNYLIYDLVESTGSESIDAILKRLDIYQRDAAQFQNNDTVWPNASVLNHTAGTNGYSGLLSASGGTAFKAFSRVGVDQGIPGRFCVMGINRDSDNDIQALCAFSGNLQSGKGDDFHTDSRFRRIGNQLQSAPGVATQCTHTGDVYLLAYTP
jgi:hypothetical protein